MKINSQVGLFGDSLSELLYALPHPAHIKDRDGNYLLSNDKNLGLYGFSKESEILGKHIRDLDSFMRPCWGKQFAEKIIEQDFTVIQQGKKQEIKHGIFLDIKGLVHIQHMFKFPITNQDDIVGILTLSYEVTHERSDIDLFNLYLDIHQTKKEAVAKFMTYLKINELFIENPTPAELKCLLLMQESRSYKSIANKLKVSDRTIETHIHRIIDKSKSLSLTEILRFIQYKSRSELF